MKCDPVTLIVEPLMDGDYHVTIDQVVRIVDECPFRMEMYVDEDAKLRIMI